MFANSLNPISLSSPVTYHGYIHTPRDALVLFEASNKGMLKKVNRRLTNTERDNFVKSGSVFIWEEDESGIKRWTDGRLWCVSYFLLSSIYRSPSRIQGSFLVYNEVKSRNVKYPPEGEGSSFIKIEHGLIKKAISIALDENNNKKKERFSFNFSNKNEKVMID
jgi:hypothetical protein